jgi:hypothetical protein
MEKKICYLILAHSDPTQLRELVTSLDYNAVFHIHIDRKVDIRPFRTLFEEDNVKFVQLRRNVAWADFSQVDATLLLIRQALATRDNLLKIVLLSGTCYPVKSAMSIYSFFESDGGKEHIKYIDMRESPKHYMHQICRQWFKKPFYDGSSPLLTFGDKAIRALLNMIKLKNFWQSNIIPYFGSQWWALSPKCCEFIIDYVKENTWYYRMNKKTFSPDEHFFHTIIGNSQFKLKSSGVQKFDGRGTSKLANLHLIHPSLSKWYTIDDLNEIERSDKLFIRKLRTGASSSLIDILKKA